MRVGQQATPSTQHTLELTAPSQRFEFHDVVERAGTLAAARVQRAGENWSSRTAMNS